MILYEAIIYGTYICVCVHIRAYITLSKIHIKVLISVLAKVKKIASVELYSDRTVDGRFVPTDVDY